MAAINRNHRPQSSECAFHIANSVSLPTYVIATIDHPKIMPEAITFPGAPDTRYSGARSCVGAPARILARDCTLHHLGNDLYGGEPNSQLQLRTEGIERQYTFVLSGIPSRMPRLRIYARGVQCLTQIKINGVITNRLADSDPDGDLSLYAFTLNGTPASLLRVGTNSLTIKTGPNNTNDPWDDIEYCALMLYIE